MPKEKSGPSMPQVFIINGQSKTPGIPIEGRNLDKTRLVDVQSSRSALNFWDNRNDSDKNGTLEKIRVPPQIRWF